MMGTPLAAGGADSFSLCCMTVRAKGPNDAAFLSHTKKMMRSSFGVLVWMIVTFTAPYIYAIDQATRLVGAANMLNGAKAGAEASTNAAGTDAGNEAMVISFELGFVYITFLALFMMLPACCVPTVVPICGYIGAKNQDTCVLNFVVCQHGTGAIGGTTIVLYSFYKLASMMNDAGVSVSDAADAAGDASDTADATGNGDLVNYGLLFMVWCLLLLVLHWCAFCSGRRATNALASTNTMMVMAPMQPVQPAAGVYQAPVMAAQPKMESNIP